MRRARRDRHCRFRLGAELLEPRRLLAGDLVTEADEDTVPASLAGDIDSDGHVSFQDFLIMVNNFGRTNASRAQGDLDGDAAVHFSDFLILVTNFGRSRTGNDEPDDTPDKSGKHGPKKPDNARGAVASSKFKLSVGDFRKTVNAQRAMNSDAFFGQELTAADAVYFPVYQAGSRIGTPGDSPTLRIDSNEPGSPYAGVGSLEIVHPSLGTFICSGSVIAERHVLTAAHCFDLDNDGAVDAGMTAKLLLNDGPQVEREVAAITIHPDFGGFTTEGANDDLAVLTLATPVPVTTPRYAIGSESIPENQTLEFVGYGQSGFGDEGFSILPNFVDKRAGMNQADLFVVDDEGGGLDEIFMFDFDDPTGSTGIFGGATLGNDIETTVGGGDSGGPAFVEEDGERVLVGVSTFIFVLEGTTPPEGFFGSLGGGILVAPYAPWITSIVSPPPPPNHPPSFDIGADQTVREDAGPQRVDGWATNITAGSEEEASQSLRFIISHRNPELFKKAPEVSLDGTLTFSPAPDAHGLAEISIKLVDDGGTANGGNNASPTETFRINLLPINDAPAISIGDNLSVAADSPLRQEFKGFATDFDPGNDFESGQSIAEFLVNSDTPALFTVPPHIDHSGRLSFERVPGAVGVATVSVQVRDDGGTDNGGVDTSVAQVFTITVRPRMDLPGITLLGDVTVNEDSGKHSIEFVKFTTDRLGLDQDELRFRLENDNHRLFRDQPEIDAHGRLTFSTAADAFGIAHVAVTLRDVKQADDAKQWSRTFTITVLPVNDAPSVNLRKKVVVANKSGVQVYPNFAKKFEPGGGKQEADQEIAEFSVVNDHEALFRVQPDIDNDGQLSFTVAANVSGKATVEVRVQDDGGVANGGIDTSETSTFVVIVLAVGSRRDGDRPKDLPEELPDLIPCLPRDVIHGGRVPGWDDDDDDDEDDDSATDGDGHDDDADNLPCDRD